jgi:DNA-binding transcriptional ArsR family regulator
MIDTDLSADLEGLAEVLNALEEDQPGVSEAAIRFLAEECGVHIGEGRPPHPVMLRHPKHLFPDYPERLRQAHQMLEDWHIPNPPEALVFLVIHLSATDHLDELAANRKTPPAALRVYWELMEACDEYLEIEGAQVSISRKMDLSAPRVSQLFRRLREVGLIEKAGYSRSTGRVVWRLLTPTRKN